MEITTRLHVLFMAALRSRCGHYIFVLWFLILLLLLLSFFPSPNLSGRRVDVYLPYFYTWCGLSANLECRSENVLHADRWKYGTQK